MFATNFQVCRDPGTDDAKSNGDQLKSFRLVVLLLVVPLDSPSAPAWICQCPPSCSTLLQHSWSRSSVSPESTLELPSRIRNLLSQRLGNRRADMWFDSASTVRVESGKLAVDAESSFAADWIRKNFGGDLRAVSQEALGRDDFDLRVVQLCPTQSMDAPPRSTETSDPASERPVFVTPTARPRTTEAWRRLEDFVVGPTNKMAFDAASSFASGNVIGNCLVIHGSCGVGKSHLLQALCRRRRESRTQQRVRYVTAEQFTNEYIQSVRHGTIDAFRARVRRVDVLAIDDVHFLAGKTATQTEFLHTLDAVQLSGSQVVLASDEHPHLVRRLSQSLISRMLAGMVVRIDAPDLALRQALVKSVALRKSIVLSSEAVDAMACHCVNGAREIEGAFASLQAMRLAQNSMQSDNPLTTLHTQSRDEISCGIVETLFRRENATRGTIPVRLSDIIEQVCLIMGIDAAQLAGESRHRHITLARALIAWLARHHTSMSFPEIARAMKRNSHSAIHSGATRIEVLIQKKATVDAGTAGTCMIVEILERLRQALRNSQQKPQHNSQRNAPRQVRA